MCLDKCASFVRVSNSLAKENKTCPQNNTGTGPSKTHVREVNKSEEAKPDAFVCTLFSSERVKGH